MVGPVEGPPALPVEEEGDLRSRGRPGHLGECLQVASEAERLLPSSGTGAEVGEECAVELLRTGTARPPLEEHRAVGAARDRLQRPQTPETRPLWHVRV